MTNGIPLGSPLLLPVDTVNCVRTLKVSDVRVTDLKAWSTVQQIVSTRDAIEFHAFAPFSALTRRGSWKTRTLER